MSNNIPYIIIQCPNCSALLPEAIIDPTSYCGHCNSRYIKPAINDHPCCNICKLSNTYTSSLVLFRCNHYICIDCWNKTHCPLCK